MRCTRCGAENREGRRFCGECGALLSSACPSCGFANEPGEWFCGGCGAALGERRPPDEPRATAPPVVALPQAYTPRHLAEKILTSRSAIEGERKQVTVLFADTKGSMELLAGRDPEEVRALLDPVLERMMEAVHRYEGTVSQVMGDGIMALFGAPLAHEDHAVRACFAGLRMQETIRRYADEVQRRAGVAIHIRVGLNSGEVVVRSIGSDLHMDYSAIGQTTYLAARMEQSAMPGSILMTADVLRLTEGYVQVKPLGPILVKGFATPVVACELTGAGPVRSRLQMEAARGLTPFANRDAELAALHAALEQARDGRGQLVAIVGEPGVGKSRMCWELVNGSPRTRDWLTLQASAVSYGKSTPYLLVVDLLRAYFQIEEHDDAWKIREKITTKIVSTHRPLEPMIPAFFGLFDVPVEDPDWQTLDPPQRRWRTLGALRGVVLLESAIQPVLIVVESLQWIDSETQAFLDGLIEVLPVSRLVLLVTYRPEYPDPWRDRLGYRPIRLESLPPAAIVEMLDALLGSDPSVGTLKEMLVRQTQGNPLFLEETVVTLVETAALAGERGAYRLARAHQTIQVPSTVHAVLAARIDRLSPEEKQILQAASVIGAEVSFSLLYAVAGLPEDTLRRYIMNLEVADFVRKAELFPDLAYALKHVLTQEVAYASLVHERRRALHARVVEALEAQAPDRVLEQIERLAYHALRGEMWDKAVRYCRQAGMKAATRSANCEVLDYLQQALAALRRLPESRQRMEMEIDLRLDLRPALLQLGRFDELLDVSRQAEGLAQQLDDEMRLGRVYSWLTNYYYLKGELQQAIEHGERCLAIADRTGDDGLRSLAERYMGHVYHTQGNCQRADEILRINIARIEATPERDTNATIAYVDAMAWRAFALADLGDFEQAYAHLDRAQHAAETSRHAYSQAIACTLSGLVFLRQGHLERAAPPLERALHLCADKTLVVWQPIPSSVLGLTRILLGQIDDGLRLLEDGVNLSNELGIVAYLSLWTVHLAEGQLAARLLDAARATATRALELATHHGERGHQAWALRLLGEVAARRVPADRDTAEAHYCEALSIATELGLRPLAAHCQLGLGQLYERAGDRVRAEEQITAATATFWETDMRRWLKQAELELTRLGQLFIVGRHNPGLYEYLSREFAGQEKVHVILDRRTGDRQMLTALGVATKD